LIITIFQTLGCIQDNSPLTYLIFLSLQYKENFIPNLKFRKTFSTKETWKERGKRRLSIEKVVGRPTGRFILGFVLGEHPLTPTYFFLIYLSLNVILPLIVIVD
jgi:hypothetical protein